MRRGKRVILERVKSFTPGICQPWSKQCEGLATALIAHRFIASRRARTQPRLVQRAIGTARQLLKYPGTLLVNGSLSVYRRRAPDPGAVYTIVDPAHPGTRRWTMRHIMWPAPATPPSSRQPTIVRGSIDGPDKPGCPASAIATRTAIQGLPIAPTDDVRSVALAAPRMTHTVSTGWHRPTSLL